MMASKKHPASFRDPAGFIFSYGGKIYRQVNQAYSVNYNLLKTSGLYEQLIDAKKMLPHTEMEECLAEKTNWFKTLLPEQLPFISYPYEWCFRQWKDAALLTLDIQKISIRFGMILKDATPFNIQFLNGSPILIDTLSFEKYDPAKPWIAYRQFIECFIGPLLLARYHSQELLKLFREYPDGIPVRLLAKLLPSKSKLNLNVWMHVFLPASMPANKNNERKEISPFSQQKLERIIDNLVSFVQSMKLPPVKSVWNDYYDETVLGNGYVEEKKKIIQGWMQSLPVRTAIDLGSNTGLFAKMMAAVGISTLAVDADTECIERLYNDNKQNKITQILPLVVDLTNPTPAIGWDNCERDSFFPRVHADLCLALALVHHLAIGKNIGFGQMAETFSRLAPKLIIEFIPKSDPKVELLLQNRTDIFNQYDEESFTKSFETFFTIEKRESVYPTARILFFMRRREILPET